MLTIALVAINVAVYLLMVVRGVSPISPTTGQLLQWGANFGPFALGGQPWRVFTSNYVHIGIIHIALNMWCLWNLGRLAERVFRPVTMFVVYTLCGIAGSVASLWWHPRGVGAGASGAIFGLAGAIITVLYLGKLPIPKQALQPILKSVVYFAVINLILGGTIPGIDNSAHVGGLVMGLALGAILGQVLMHPREQRLRTEVMVFVAAAAVLAGVFVYFKRAPSDEMKEGRAAEALQSNRTDDAIALLQPLVKQHPEDPTASVLLAQAYLQKQDYPGAEAMLNLAQAHEPYSRRVLFLRGMLARATQKPAAAVQAFRDLVKQRPTDEQAWYLLGASLRDDHRDQDAANALERAVALDPGNTAALKLLAQTRIEMGEFASAVAVLQKVAALLPNDAQAQVALGRAYLAAGKKSESEAAFHTAERLLQKAQKPQ